MIISVRLFFILCLSIFVNCSVDDNNGISSQNKPDKETHRDLDGIKNKYSVLGKSVADKAKEDFKNNATVIDKIDLRFNVYTKNLKALDVNELSVSFEIYKDDINSIVLEHRHKPRR
jgi:hypothetical protein